MESTESFLQLVCKNSDAVQPMYIATKFVQMQESWSRRSSLHTIQAVVYAEASRVSDRNAPVAKGGVELDDHLFLLLRDVPPLEISPQVVDPSQPAALPAPQKPCSKD